MPHAAPARSFIDEPFRLVGGHVAADFVNTVNWEARGLDRDRFGDYGRVVEWAVAAGVIDRPTAERLGAAARARPGDAVAAYEAARWLREVLHRLLTAVGHGELDAPEGTRALADFNALLAAALRPLRIGIQAPAHGGPDGPGQGLAWSWDGAESRLDAVLWPVVWAAAHLLASTDAAQLRVCGGPDCGWVYVDRSRNGLRRWCEMQTCGTVEKSRRRAERQRRPN